LSLLTLVQIDKPSDNSLLYFFLNYQKMIGTFLVINFKSFKLFGLTAITFSTTCSV